VISSFTSRDYFSSSQSRVATAFCFLEAVCFFSMELHIKRRARSSSRFFYSNRNMSRACCSAKKVVSTASGTETYPRAPRSGCPMTTLGPSRASSPMTAEVVTASIWGTPTVGLDGVVMPPSATSLIVTEAAAPIVVVVTISGTVSMYGVPSPRSTSIDGPWASRHSETSWAPRAPRALLAPDLSRGGVPLEVDTLNREKFQSMKVQIERKKKRLNHSTYQGTQV
jgi:hypothetical protein